MNHGKNIPVYELPDKEQVSKYAKTYKDVEKNKSLMPDQKFINKKHDIYVKGGIVYDDEMIQTTQ